MNRNKREMPRRVGKAMEKEVKRSQTAMVLPTPPIVTMEPSPAKILKRYPKKIAEKAKSQMMETEEVMEMKRAKQNTKHHRRTTPGDVPRDADFSEPQIVHIESRRWIKTLVKQNQVQNKILNKKMGKKRGNKL